MDYNIRCTVKIIVTLMRYFCKKKQRITHDNLQTQIRGEKIIQSATTNTVRHSVKNLPM